ncbi:MAG TPA: aminopeptidase N, partial [Micromonospora sp.]
MTAPVVGTKNLTRDEAVDRAALLTLTSYDLTLDLTDGADGPGVDTFRCVTEVVFDCARPGASVRIELAGVAVHSAVLNGTPVEVGDWSAEQGLPLTGLAARNVLVVDAEFAYSTSGQGLHRAVDPLDGEVYVYTHFEPTAAQRVFACFDQPDLKATFTWRATVPGHWRVVSNMPAAGTASDGRTRTVEFPPTPRMSTYLAALCAGPFHEVTAEHDGIGLGLYCRRSMAPALEADDILTVTRQGFDFFHDRFGIRYPLPKYDQIFVPEYNTGAMENFGAVTFSEQHYLFRSQATQLDYEHRASTILHELAHVWLGNLVTMRWWDELWLKEALATWASYWACTEATRFTDAWTTFLLSRKIRGYEEDQLSSTHPIWADVPDVATALANFDGITYAKGASFIKQLAAYVGVDSFVAGLRDYFATHQWGNASLADLVGALEAASGRELTGTIRRWLDTVRVDTLRPELTVDPDGRCRGAVVRRSTPEAYPTPRAHRIAVGRYRRDGERLVRAGRTELDVTAEATALPELVGIAAGDLLLLNDDDLSYAKIRFDARSLRTLREDLWRIESPLARALCHCALSDMVHDAEL